MQLNDPVSISMQDPIFIGIKHELETLFAAHKAVGLEGKMCLYTHPAQNVWRAQEAGKLLWFGENEIPAALSHIQHYYNGGNLPNSPMLLNPIIHTVGEDGNIQAKGSGIVWCTAFCMGLAKLGDDQIERIRDLGVLTTPFHRGDNDRAGLKMVGFSDKALLPDADAWTVSGCKELYNIAMIDSPDYAPYYLLSGLNYLCAHGLFNHPVFATLAPADKNFTDSAAQNDIIATHKVSVEKIADASQCWDAYDHHHSLFKKFGTNPADIAHNLRFYNMCNRDVGLFDATGVRHLDAETHVGFDFLVNGWIPKGAVTVIGASGGTGKSSLAHNLAVKMAIDWKEGETVPTWLGSKINPDMAKGLIVYLSGEDGPAIVHARAKVYDPEGRSERLLMQRTDFGEGVTLAGFLKRLRALPDVPLVVIDPARKYLTGDENDAGVVSEFFEAIEEFAINKHAAVVVVHHLAKGARPKHVADIYDLLRGSQVFIDRPRVVIGMYRDGPYTIAGLAKNNIPPQLGMVQGERVYARDADRLELVQLPGAEGVRNLDMTLQQDE